MVIASGFIEANDLNDVDGIVSNLKVKDIEVNEINADKIVFLIERETMKQIKTDIAPLRNIEGVRNVHVAYYSIEGADEEDNGRMPS